MSGVRVSPGPMQLVWDFGQLMVTVIAMQDLLVTAQQSQQHTINLRVQGAGLDTTAQVVRTGILIKSLQEFAKEATLCNTIQDMHARHALLGSM